MDTYTKLEEKHMQIDFNIQSHNSNGKEKEKSMAVLFCRIFSFFKYN